MKNKNAFNDWMSDWERKLDELMQNAGRLEPELTRDMAIRITDKYLSASGQTKKG